MNTLTSHLSFLGLNEKQVATYLALVQLGEATGYEVAQLSQIKRPTTYVILDELRQKGLILKVPHAKKHLYIAKSPEEVLMEYEEKLKNAKRQLPHLLSSLKKNRKVNVIYFDGKKGVQESLHYKLSSLASHELLGFYAKGQSSSSTIPKTYYDYNKKLFAQKSKVRGFAPLHPSLKKFRDIDKTYGWNIIPLKLQEFSSDVSLEVAPTFVRIMLHKNAQSVIIESEAFAHTMKEIFEMLWKNKVIITSMP